MADNIGGIWVPTGSAEIRDVVLRDLRLAALQTGMAEPPVQPGTDWFILASAMGELGLIGFTNVAISDEDKSILTSTGAQLDAQLEANGLPQVPASGSTGKIEVEVFGPTTIVNGTQLLLPNGLRIRVVGNYLNPADGADIDVESIDVGEETNLGSGETVRFVSPPTNVAEEAVVSDGSPLTGGTNVENENRKRARLLNTLRNKPAGGNWADIRRIALEALGSISDCVVYPGLGGPGSCLVVPFRDFDVENRDFSRAVSTAALQTVRGEIQSKLPSPQEIVVQASTDQPVDFSLLVTIPDSAMAGGNGQGWTDQVPWPQLEPSDNGRTPIMFVGANDQIAINANTFTPPYAGQTHIAWWSSVDCKFQTALVVAVSGSSGTWTVTLDHPFVASDGSGPQSGDFVCPAAQNLDKYAETWIELFRALGPGEATSDANRLPRSKRHPFASDELPHTITTSNLLTLVRKHPEITDISFGYAPQRSPSIPSSVATPPNILIPRHFAIYAIT